MADRKISELTALTTPATGDLIPIVDISEAAAADKNKSITVGELLRGAPNGTAAAPSFAFESDGNTGIYRPGADQVAISTNGTGRLFVDSSGRLLVGTSTDSGGALLQVNGDRIRVGSAKTPASATDTGTAGEICWDANYIYICTATNTWKRSAISTW